MRASENIENISNKIYFVLLNIDNEIYIYIDNVMDMDHFFWYFHSPFLFSG